MSYADCHFRGPDGRVYVLRPSRGDFPGRECCFDRWSSGEPGSGLHYLRTARHRRWIGRCPRLA